MQCGTETAVANKKLRAARILCALAVLVLISSSAGQCMIPASVAKTFVRFGYPASLGLGVGMFDLACILIHLVPHAPVLGVLSLIPSGAPLLDTLFPIILGVVVWAVIFLR
ncbi:MAG TPA: hypothetical protein VG860_07895 [Terriglobia bacterium]|jgi:hypothetical protein|nr:hypothetical protein [Terriglobia bacterium]